MAFFTISDTLHQKHLFSISLCKYPLPLTFSPPKHSLSLRKSPFFVVSQTHAKLSTTGHEPSSTETIKLRANGENTSGVPLFRSLDERVSRKSVERSNVSLVEEEERNKRFTNDRYTKKRVGSGSRREMGSGSSSSSSVRSKYGSLGVKSVETRTNSLVDGKINKNLRKGYENIKVGEEKMQKGSIKNKAGPRVAQLTLALEMCSKRGDVMGAIELYDSARREGITLGQYHYAVVLYLCSSAAGGVVRPAKSGSGNRILSLNALDSSNEVSNVGRRNFNGTGVGKEDSDRSPNGNDNIIPFSELGRANPKFINGAIHMRKGDNSSGNLKDGNDDKENEEILVSGDVKKYALQRGFDIYEKMCLEKVPMNEAILTSVARLAMSMGDGDMAFDMVKQIKTLGINLRLRSYGPALSAFCSSGDIEKAFAVEKHMLEHGVYPEEPELEALLRVSIEAGKSDKVYYLLHKLRSSVRKVSPSTAELIEKWFKSKEASRVGKGKWDKKLIKEAIECGGGGWHGQGWLGKGRWTVSRTTVGDDGLCKCCGVKLEIIDLDPTETENFAKSVASIAMQREKHSNFQRFQQWLDYYGPFEAVVDAANVGLFSQKRFMPSKINAVVNGIRQMLPSKKWPLIVLHNRRITGHKMDEPVNKALIEKWKIADALYATPTGSNDDWYWLYAAIKFKCLLVTNDEMRDHTFQLLGNDFFPKWKERHQVHFSFSDTGPEFHMPPPCSVVIQESEIGHWHIPVVSEHNSEGERTWLCITRAHSQMERQASTTRSKGSDTQNDVHTKPKPSSRQSKREVPRNPPQEMYKNLRNILSKSVFSSHHPTILSEIEAAELLGNCIIDFEI